MPRHFHILLALLLAGCMYSAAPESADNEVLNQLHVPAFRGVSWTASDTIDAHSLDRVEALGVNYLALIPFGYQKVHNGPEIETFFDQTHIWAESDAGIAHTNRLARRRGMHTMLKPHLWMHSQGSEWRANIAMDSDLEWKEWFENYSAFILHYAQLAEEAGIETFCVGTELQQTVIDRPQDWRELISKVRNVYSGQLTYAANFHHEYEVITFWDALDFIGIQAYFPLTSEECPTTNTLLDGWKKHVQRIEAVAEKFQKPVVFTEVGYRSSRDAAVRPWEWPESSNATYADTSFVTQARCYEALFQTFESKPWFEGVMVWKWFPRHYAIPEEYEKQRLERVRQWQSSTPRVDFTPQDKPAEKVIGKWFQKWQALEKLE